MSENIIDNDDKPIRNDEGSDSLENFRINMDNDDQGESETTEIVSKSIGIINQYLIHRPLAYGKKFYISEFLAERTIQIIAFTSIAFILAIFYYVFQEAAYAFKDPQKVTFESAGANSNIQDKPESYGDSGTGDLKPESYGAANTEDLKPETYGSDTPANTSDVANKPEQYAPESYIPGQDAKQTDTNSASQLGSLESGRLSSQSMETSGAEKAVNIGMLLSPNDYIDNKPQYIWQPIGTEPKYSLVPLFLGALKVTAIGLLIAAPIAILAAIFTVAFSTRWMREIMKPAIEILAGFPSVVIGFFCLMTLATVIQNLFGTTFRLNSFVGGIGMALAVIPIIYTVTEDALSAVPKYMKEASLALGASRWQTAYRVILPAATPGVFAAIILGFGRAFGETMIALMATGNAALVSMDIFESVRTMAATIGAEMAEVEFHGIHYGVLFLIGSILFVITFSLNALAEFWVRKRLLKRFQGK